MTISISLISSNTVQLYHLTIAISLSFAGWPFGRTIFELLNLGCCNIVSLLLIVLSLHIYYADAASIGQGSTTMILLHTSLLR